MDRYVTSHLAAKTADGMLTPLMDSDDDDSDEDSDFDSSASFKVETIKRTPMQVLKSLVGKHIGIIHREDHVPLSHLHYDTTYPQCTLF